MKGALGQSVSFKLKTCTRRASDSIDKRFFVFRNINISNESFENNSHNAVSMFLISV